MEIVTSRVHIPSATGKTMGGFLARPADDVARPAVLVFMEIFGINGHIRDVTERLAREGYVALAPDYFHRTGPGVEYGYDDVGLASGIKLLGGLRAEEMVSDARDAMAFLRARDDVRGDRIGCVGFCIGGHMSWLVACETDVRAAVSFYGGGIAASHGPGGAPSSLTRAAGIRGKLLCLFGGKDRMIPLSQIDAIRAQLATHRVRHEVVVYPDADHGFFCDQRATFHPDSTRDAWARTKALFASELA